MQGDVNPDNFWFQTSPGRGLSIVARRYGDQATHVVLMKAKPIDCKWGCLRLNGQNCVFVRAYLNRYKLEYHDHLPTKYTVKGGLEMLRASVPDEALIPLPKWKNVSDLSYSVPPLVAPDKRKRSKGRRKKRRFEAGKGCHYSQKFLDALSTSQSATVDHGAHTSCSEPVRPLNRCSLCGEVGHNKVRCTASIDHMGRTLTSAEIKERIDAGHLIIEVSSVRGGTKLPLTPTEFHTMQRESPYSTEPFVKLWQKKNKTILSVDDVTGDEEIFSGNLGDALELEVNDESEGTEEKRESGQRN